MFELKPLSAYVLPRYGRINPDATRSWAAWLLRRGGGKLAALLLVAGLGLGGCAERAGDVRFDGGDLDRERQEEAERDEAVSENPDLENPDSDGDADPDIEPAHEAEPDKDPMESPEVWEYYPEDEGKASWSCTTGTVYSCLDKPEGSAVAVCRDGQIELVSCAAYCAASGHEAALFAKPLCSTPFSESNPCACEDGQPEEN